MTHCPTEDVILDYTAGRLNPVQAARFERHADVCTDCAALRTEQTAVWQSLDEWKPAPVSAGFSPELWRRIDADARDTSWARELAALMSFAFWKRVAPLAVALAVVVTAFVMDHSGNWRGQTPPAVASAPIVVTVSEADQLDRALDDMQLLDAVDAASASARRPGSESLF